MFTLKPASHLTVRPFRLSDAESLYAQVEANREHLRKWLTWVDVTQSPSDTSDFIQRANDQWARGDGYQAAILWDNSIVGAIGLHYLNHQILSTEIGYWLAKEFNGRGIMTAAVRAVTTHAFETWNLNRIEIRAAVGNTRSRAVPERLGFQLDGMLRQVLNLYGELHDLAVYSVLRREWKELPVSSFQ